MTFEATVKWVESATNVLTPAEHDIASVFYEAGEMDGKAEGRKAGYRAAIDDVKAQFLKNAETSHGPYSWQAAVMAIDAMSKEG